MTKWATVLCFHRVRVTREHQGWIALLVNKIPLSMFTVKHLSTLSHMSFCISHISDFSYWFQYHCRISLLVLNESKSIALASNSVNTLVIQWRLLDRHKRHKRSRVVQKCWFVCIWYHAVTDLDTNWSMFFTCHSVLTLKYNEWGRKNGWRADIQCEMTCPSLLMKVSMYYD